MKSLVTAGTISLLFYLVFLPQHASSQNFPYYYNIVALSDSYFSSHPELMKEGDGAYMKYLRWKELWRSRVYGKSERMSGSFDISLQAWRQYFDEQSKYSSSSVIGSDWLNLGPKNLEYHDLGIVTSLYVDTVNDHSRNTIYAGTGSSGIWKTYDGGKHWFNTTDGSEFGNSGITTIIGDPSNPNLLFASCGGGYLDRNYSCRDGIFKSTDRGFSWQRIYPALLTHHMNVGKIVMDPTDSQRLYAGVDSVLIRSENGGGSWDTIFEISQIIVPSGYDYWRMIRDLELKPNDAGTLYLSTDDIGPWASQHLAQIWKLTNIRSLDTSLIGKTELDNQIDTVTIYTDRWELGVTPADPEAIYAQCGRYNVNLEDSYYYLWKFRAGIGWRLLLSYGGNAADVKKVGYYKNVLIVSPADTSIMYVGGDSFHKFHNRINTLSTQLDSGGFHMADFHVDIRCVVLTNALRNIADTGRYDSLFVGNDGGVSRSINGSKTWHSINGDGLAITQFWSLGGVASQAELLAGGSQDNSLFTFSASPAPIWKNPNNVPGDVGNVIFDNNHRNWMYFPCWGSLKQAVYRDSLLQTTYPNILFFDTA